MNGPGQTNEKLTRHNRVREALNRIYEEHPAYFRDYLRRFREDPTSRVFAPLAEAYRKMGRVEEATQICLEGLKHHPDFFGGRVALAKCYLDRGYYEEARVELDRVVSAVPENLMAQRLLGDTYSATGDAPRALHCYKMALLLSPNDVALADLVHKLEKDGPGPTVSVVTDLRPVAQSTPPEKTQSVSDDLPLDPVLDEGESQDEVGPTSTSELVNSLLGYKGEAADTEAFSVAPLDSVFQEDGPAGHEITTATLGDLYFAQGQSKKALAIFERLYKETEKPDFLRKVTACRERLGMAQGELLRHRQTAYLESILKRVRSMAA